MARQGAFFVVGVVAADYLVGECAGLAADADSDADVVRNVSPAA
jgi:hypothetical protein